MSDFNELAVDLPLFDGVPREKVPHVLKCLNASLAHYSKGERIYRGGEQQRRCSYLCEGTAYLASNDYWGNRSILNEYDSGSVIVAGRFFGLGDTMPADVIAADECTTLQFDLQKHVEAKPCCMVHVERIRANLARMIVQMNAQLIDRMGILANRSTREKVLAYLSRQAELNGSTTFDIPHSRQELADALYVERSALSHELGKLQKEGCISFSRRHFTLHKVS